MSIKHSDTAYIEQMNPPDNCTGCQQRDRLINQVVREQEVLATLAVKQKAQLAKMPANPVKLAKLLNDRHSDAFLDAVWAEIVRLKGG